VLALVLENLAVAFLIRLVGLTNGGRPGSIALG
jgi:hypothetical protein